MTTDSRGTYTYNARNLLTTVTATGLAASYGYDPGGLRAVRTVNGHTTYAVRGLGGQVLSEFTTPCGALTWAKDLVYAGGRPLGAARASAAKPTVAVTAATASVNESQASMSVGVQLTTPGGAALACPVTVAYEITAGTATLGADVVRAGGTVTFTTGSASGAVQAIPITLVPDSTNEPLETFTVLLSTATGADISTPAGQVVTILDDDVGPAMAVEAPLVQTLINPANGLRSALG